ncbi:hypothetical protein [Streptomyces sp. 1222.5]|uniref:hypothetical protein n=1 Tax=Streptomyces sp. 1222.5 TaxID=1881026 RepID=UPI003EBD7FDA
MESGMKRLRSEEGYTPLERGANLTSLSFDEMLSGDSHERGTVLGSREGIEVPGDRHGEAGVNGNGEIPTLIDRFDSAAGTGHDSIVELASANPTKAQIDAPPAAIDPVSLPPAPLAPEAMTPANPFHLASFLTKFLCL